MRYMSVLPRSSMRHSAAAPGLLRVMPGPGWSQSTSAQRDDSSLYNTCKCCHCQLVKKPEHVTGSRVLRSE